MTDTVRGDFEKIMGDKVNHPSHYTEGRKYETIDVIADNLTEEGFEGFCIGCVFKYISRYRKKNGLEDLKKAEWYLKKIIEKKEENG